jgi:DNA-binding beta-propeller fold protein YncE
LPVAVAALLVGSGERPRTVSAEVALPLIKSTEPEEICLLPERPPHAEETEALQRSGGGGADGQSEGSPRGWPGRNTIGGNIPPTAHIADPWPTYDGMAVDSENGIVVMSDENRHGVLIYNAAAGSDSTKTTEPRGRIIGPRVKLGFVAGVTVNPKKRELMVTNNDGGGLEVFSYDSNCDVRPVRSLTVPHQSWGLSYDVEHDEIAVTSQQYQGISIYGGEDAGAVRPKRTIRGMDTQLADPHGVFLDDTRDEVFTANHGNWTEMRSYAGDEPAFPGQYIPGKFEQSAIRVYKASANGNVPPLRVLQGKQTQLEWPMGITLDKTRNELLVANYGNSSILVFNAAAKGDSAPARVIGGPRTGIVGPVAVGVDTKRNEIWVANYGDHSAVVFDRTASGNVAPKRIVRNAPAGTPTTGFTNAASAAYDSNRDELLVPN